MSDLNVDLSKPEKGHTYRQWLIAILANTTVLTYGIQIGWISPMTKVLQSNESPTGHPLSDTDLSWIASVLCLTAVVGVHVYTYVAEKIGRKPAVILIAVPQALCWIIKLSSANTATLIVARVFAGLAAGACFNIVAIYVKEISQDDIRGLTGSLMMLSLNFGFLIMYTLGTYLSYFTVLWTVTWIPFATCLLMLKAPESPSYLVKIGKNEEATSVIAWLRGHNKNNKSVQNELDKIINEKHLFKTLPNISYIGLFKKRLWRTEICLMMSIMSVTCLSGCFAIVTYASAIFASSGVTISAELQSLSFPIVMIIGGFISMSCIERFGRKPLLAISYFLLTLSMIGLGLAIHLQSQGYNVPGWLPAVLMMTAVASYNVGSNPVPYIVMSEMFNFQIRAKVLGLIVSYGWFINFIQLLSYTPVAVAFGAHIAFYCFGLLNFLGFLVALILLPETKGKSLEEIEEKYH